MKYLIAFIVAIVVCINAAPIDEEFASELKAALQPVQHELRALLDNAEFAVKDLTDQAIQSANDLSVSAKQLINPEDRSLQRNLVEQSKLLGAQAQDLGRALIEKAVADYEPIQSNERAAYITAGDALRMVENKYLTKDGQDLVRTLSGAARRLTFV